ncbi:glycogen synthase GlgA [Entomospira entomophila]|uniref:Glycogen synthase n=1 Tax=Entomospira entomophila TaxID=2719988 RepID=A0A968KR71_9SPIO|nr:glycogen synthase GlgA [Entomospira entomophilus]NIZ40484.1 glycogen synthase GlgA [Entomospira entomophilus]WDI36042.1 glycogen synthase GlgA [Entomospira entomophilus]
MLQRKILFVTSEAVPFAKSGGLGDMVTALAQALHVQGHDVRVVMPRYYHIARENLHQRSEPLGVPHGFGEEWCAVFESDVTQTKGVPFYFIEHEGYFGRKGIYGEDSSSGFSDNFARYALLSRAAFQLCRAIQWIPDIMHAHDWPTALVPVYLQTWERIQEFFHTASVFTIHNLGYQGWFPKEDLFHAQIDEIDFYQHGLEALGDINLVKAGITTSDIITTVSPTYAMEIQTQAYGEGQDWLLRSRSDRIVGILNGIDTDIWNPQTDIHIQPYNYSAENRTNKAKMKTILQERMGLPVVTNQPLVAMISRLVSQKGVDLLIGDWGVLSRLMHYHNQVQVVIIGTGEEYFERELQALAHRFPHNINVNILFDEPLSHIVEAGADFFLMPSRYEPCGLNQMYSLRYGTLPIVRRTGGLVDTVKEYHQETGAGTGWIFNDYNVDGCWWALNDAIETYYQRPQHIEVMRERAMKEDFTWLSSAKLYEEAYERAIMYRRQ